MNTPSLGLDTPELARDYERVSAERQFKAGKVLVARLAVQPGERVLDVGSGTGLLAEHVASIVGPSGSVVGIDPLPLRVALAEERARANLAFQVGRAEDLGAFADRSFDAVVVNSVFHWLPEKRAPLREFRRVSKPRARLGIGTISKDHVGPMFRIARKVFERPPYAAFAADRPAGMRRVNEGELRELLLEAGFEVQSIELLPSRVVYATAGAAIEFSQASSFGNFLGHLPEGLRASAKDEILAEIEAMRTPEGIVFESSRLLAVARAP